MPDRPTTKDEYYKSFNDNYCKVPQHLREAIYHYITEGRPVGGFLQAVISNNLIGATTRSHPDVKEHIGGIVLWFLSYAPTDSYGSQCAYDYWTNHKEFQEVA